jgi:drug/metabolite transporter (DMT)-like permease
VQIPYLGEYFAVSTAICWSVAVLLFRQSGFHYSPTALNLFKNSIAIILLLLTLVLTGRPILGVANLTDTLILMASGIVGIAIADTLFFLSLNLLGASLSAIVDCIYSPLVVFFAHFLIGERISYWDYVGAGLIAAAVLLTSSNPKKSPITRKDLVTGILVGVFSMGLMAIGIVVAKPILDKTPVIWSATVRLIGGNAALAIYALIIPSRRKAWSVFLPQKGWKLALPASFIGAYISMIIWIAGMKMLQASISAILNQLSTIFIVIGAYLFLKEPINLRKALAVVLAFTGALVVVLV